MQRGNKTFSGALPTDKNEGALLMPRSHCVRRRTSATDGNATQHAVQIELDLYGMLPAVRRRSVCERCRRNQRAPLQRRCCN